MEHAHKAQKALDNKDYPAAIASLTYALKQSWSPLWLIQRSTAYQRINYHEAALQDADNAVLAARDRGKRELIATGHLRRGIALHSLRRFGDARLCFIWCSKYNDKEKGLTMWIAKNTHDYEKAGGDEADCNQTTVKEIPEAHLNIEQKMRKEVDEMKITEAEYEERIKNYREGILEDRIKVATDKAYKEKSEGQGEAKEYVPLDPLTPEQLASIGLKQDEPKAKTETESKGKGKGKSIDSDVAAPVPAVVQTSKEKIRQEWYQSATTVTITIFAKGIPKEEADVVIGEGDLDVSFPTGGSGTYDFTVSPLFSKIDKSKSNFRVTPHKIEITLYKAKPGVKWSALEGTEPIESSATEEAAPKIPDTILKGPEKAPAYPTSSRTGPKNWDAVLKDEKEEEGEIDDFFKKLYKDSDPDTRRAMMKSYQESGGTALSTSWGEVRDKKMEISPPDGMEAKKWEY